MDPSDGEPGNADPPIPHGLERQGSRLRMRKLIETVVEAARDASLCQRCLAALTGLTAAALRGALLDASSEVTVIVDLAACPRCAEAGLVVRIA